MNAIEINNISKSFDDKTVLHDINLTVAKGEFISLLGPSGCGKTTLLRIIAGLELPDTGKIQTPANTFVDRATDEYLPVAKRKLSYVFQDYGLWPHMSVFDNIAFALTLQKMPKADIKKRVNEVLTLVKLVGHDDKLPEQLSGGQKQRVSIARAMAGSPDIMLLDEPLSNLDANLREELGKEIRELTHKQGITCVNVTHDRKEAQLLSDRIALMKDGVIHQLTDPVRLFKQPASKWACEFLDAGNLIEGHMIHRELGEWLVPRTAFKIENDNADTRLSLHVDSCLFLDDRFEIAAWLANEKVFFYSEAPFDVGQNIFASLLEENLVSIKA
ncbi:ABC transporter ATP-binding protein [Marinomonas sp. TI.3.20]|uniref:ABC transporter ATP-binding protein n=1 Tax=Marinomonas sp. TI.3.20 TaxID=3121296 RepID=UPI00311DC3D2